MSKRLGTILGGADSWVKTTGPSFACFQDLPEELRLKIWKLALPGPRLVDICCNSPPHIRSHRRTPSILHVCSESRKEALKWYTAVLLGHTAFRVVYVNCQIDTLYLSKVDANGWMEGRMFHWRTAGDGQKIQQLLDNVRFLAIPTGVWDASTNTAQARRFIQRLSKLEELTIVYIDAFGEVTDEDKLDVSDEWQIAEEVGAASGTPKIMPSEKLLSYWVRRYVHWLKRFVMTKECGSLINIKGRIVTVN